MMCHIRLLSSQLVRTTSPSCRLNDTPLFILQRMLIEQTLACQHSTSLFWFTQNPQNGATARPNDPMLSTATFTVDHITETYTHTTHTYSPEQMKRGGRTVRNGKGNEWRMPIVECRMWVRNFDVYSNISRQQHYASLLRRPVFALRHCFGCCRRRCPIFVRSGKLSVFSSVKMYFLLNFRIYFLFFESASSLVCTRCFGDVAGPPRGNTSLGSISVLCVLYT